MKISYYRYIIVWLFVLFSFIAAWGYDAYKLFNKLKAEMIKYTPREFEVRIEGDVIREKINNLPRFIFKGNDKNKAQLIMHFKLFKGQRLLLTNIKEDYEEYRTIFETSYSFLNLSAFRLILKGETYKEFTKKFLIKKVITNKNEIIVKIANRQFEENYAYAYIDKKGFSVKRMKYFNEGNLSMDNRFYYKRLKRYYLIDRVHIKLYDDMGNIKKDIWVFYKDYRILR